MSNRAVLIILDGFGIGKDSPFNAIKSAKMPFYNGLLASYPHSQLITHGEAVGLPGGVMGNSEVGHMTMGAGRIIYQDLTRISKTILDRSFFSNPILNQAVESGVQKSGRVHLMGLLSDGGVHSHIDHLFALLDHCLEKQVPQVSVHAFLDGRDTPPDSGIHYMQRLLSHPSFREKRAEVASLMGRYWAMDRDHRWERVQKAYLAMTGQAESHASLDPIAAIQKSYALGKSDEFVEPILFDPSSAMQSGDSVIFYNYRADRAREITRAITEPEFKDFDRGRGFSPSYFAGMTLYDQTLSRAQVAFLPQSLHHIFGQWLEEKRLKQFRIAETEKYAHVTFFFNGGREKPFEGEERLLIPSPKEVPTYDLKPEMSAALVAQNAADRIRSSAYDFVLMNFANADMVGHTGNFAAAVQALETLDACLAQVIGAAERSGYHVLLTADHGNVEEMCDERGRIHTQHTLNPVPAVWVAPNSANGPKKDRIPLRDGTLEDVMPTLCRMMQLPTPPEATGRSLIPEK